SLRSPRSGGAGKTGMSAVLAVRSSDVVCITNISRNDDLMPLGTIHRPTGLHQGLARPEPPPLGSPVPGGQEPHHDGLAGQTGDRDIAWPGMFPAFPPGPGPQGNWAGRRGRARWLPWMWRLRHSWQTMRYVLRAS